MKVFLLRHYLKQFSGNPMLVGLGLAMPVITINAWIFPNALGVWTAAVVSLLGVSFIPQRPTAFETALPISGKDIAVVRSLMAFGLFMIPVILAAFVVRWVHGIPLPGFAMAQSVAIVALATLLPRLVHAREYEVAATDAFSPVGAMGVLAALSVFYLGNVVSLALLMVATVTAAAMWWRVVPETFEAAPRSLSERDPSGAVASTSEVANGTPWWHPVRSTLWPSSRMGITCLMLLMSAVGQWQMVIFFLVAVEESWQRPRWMQPLPISHRARLWMILVPAVFAPLIITFIGMEIHVPGYDYMQSLNRGAVDTYKQEPKYFDSPSMVSLEYWERTDGPLPLITSPWGETAEPYVVRVFGRVYYNPFTSRKANSDRFANLQFERATTVVFGHPMQLKDFEDGQTNPRRLTQMPRMIVLNIAATLLLAFVFLLGVGAAKWNRLWRHPNVAGTIYMVSLFVPSGFYIFCMVKYGFQQGAMNVVPQMLERQLLALSAVLPANILLVMLIASAPVLALYALLEWQFKETEVVGAMPKM